MARPFKVVSTEPKQLLSPTAGTLEFKGYREDDLLFGS